MKNLFLEIFIVKFEYSLYTIYIIYVYTIYMMKI